MFRIALAGASIAIAASAASAQLTLAIDVQGIDYQFRDTGGNAGFGGLTHTGTLEWSGGAAVSADTRIGSDGRFGSLAPVSQTAGLQSFAGELTFASGQLTGGWMSMTLDTIEEHTYTTSLQAGSGAIGASNQMGYSVDGLTIGGGFSHAAWGDIDVTPWYDAQSGGLPGALFKFRFWPGPSFNGNADIEVFVMVPLPPTAWAGLAMLGGVGAVGHVRRRRN